MKKDAKKEGFSLGHNSLEVIQTIVRSHNAIKQVKIISHPVCINWRQTFGSNSQKALHINEGLIHLLPPQKIDYTREDFLTINLENLPKINENEVWSFNSDVKCEFEDFYVGIQHIPMMNFHLDEGATENDLARAIQRICPNKEGVLLETGRYFHYYGNYLLSQEQWIRFLGQFLMPCFLVSPRYVGHALNDGYCSLRLTADKNFKPKIPTVIKRFYCL